jgi:hypothetical protein
MQINLSETMRDCLEQCVKFAISKNAWINAIDREADYEVAMDDALEFLKEVKE